jgi:two-component system, OmpR family, alkaline phosphatase synthesis response regulator PhoP
VRVEQTLAPAHKRRVSQRSAACKAPLGAVIVALTIAGMPALIMVVEDEPNIGALVRTYLERSGYKALWVRSGEEALTELRRHPIQLVVLDIGLPGIDGFEVCRRIAGEVPVIMLTARDEEPDRVAGLEVGADDYVAKPFSPRELAARVKAVLRRTGRSADAEDVIELGPLVLSRSAREVHLDGSEVELTQREFDLLEYLVRHAGQVVTRGQLLESVWGFVSPGETRTVEVHVAQLRKKLGHPELIRTVRGLGYKASA